MAHLTRRGFLKRSLRVGLGVLAAGVAGRLGWLRWQAHSPAPPRRRRPGRVLTEHEFATLEALADLIVPSDDLGPGARDVAAAWRIENWLMRDSRRLDRYRRGLRWLDQMAALTYGPGRTFLSLSPSEREALLLTVERDVQAWRRPPASLWDRAWRYWERLLDTLVGLEFGALFFYVVREDVLAAVYSDPRVWSRLGYDGPPQPLGYWDGAGGTWNLIDRCPPVKRTGGKGA